MPSRLFDEVKNWANGINTSAAPDQIPEGASPRGRNTTLKQIGENTALVSTRRGLLTLNSTPVTGSPALWGFQFKKESGTNYNLLVSNTGRLDILNSDGSLTAVSSPFTSGDHPPIFAVANDLCFIVNDVDQKKFDGTNVRNFGITRPSAPTATPDAGGSMAEGVWEVALSYYNSATGHESSRSDATSVTLTAGNQKIDVSWSAPADAQVTHVRVYIRQNAAGPNFYRAIAGATPAADGTHGGYAPATTATELDISASQYSAFVLLAPSTTENNPPASGLQGPCWHNSRLFLFDAGNIYYSTIRNNTPYPEAFHPDDYDPVSPNDGDTIIGLYSYGGVLYIFKKFSLWKLEGTDPNSWDIAKVSDTPCSSMRSIVEADGILYWWGGHLGLIGYGSGAPISLGKQFLASSIDEEVLNETGYETVCGGVDENNETLLMAVPGVGSTRNTLIIPFNYRLRRFAAEYWNPLDVNSMWAVETSEDLKALYLGGYAGQAFEFDAARNDGVPTGTTSSGSVTSATSTTLVDSGASFANTGGKLVDRYVYAISSDRLSVQRRRITNNTATELTVTPAWDVTPNTTYSYVVGGIDFSIDTPWMTNPTIFTKKRYEFIYVQAESSDPNIELDVDLFVSMNDTDPKRSKRLSAGGTGGVYDDPTSIYDSTVYAGRAVTFGKIRAACVGRAWKIRVRGILVDKSVSISKIALQVEVLGFNR